LKKVKNDRLKQIAVRKGKGSELRVHVSGLGDGITWQVKTLKNVCKCPRDVENNMASYRWTAEQLLTNYKVNPNLQVHSMQQLCMERY